MEPLIIRPISSNSDYLNSVISLGDKNKRWLGMMPREAFLEYASKKQILIATTKSKVLAGYLLYGKSSTTIRLAHLCVDESFRGQGVGKKLTNHLAELSKQQGCTRIKLSCRRDYGLAPMWRSFGFTAKSEKKGRGKSSKILTVWTLEHEHPPLLKVLLEVNQESKISPVIDLNVFYDFYDCGGDRDIEDSAALMSDWLEDIDFQITEEAQNEIHDIEDESHRKEVKQFSNNFSTLPCVYEDYKIAEALLQKIFSQDLSTNSKADLRHLARAIGANAKFFITRDQDLLKKSDEVYKETGLVIVRPSSFVMRIDELQNESQYQPARLHGTLLQENRIRASEQEEVCKAFLAQGVGEAKSRFSRFLQAVTGYPQEYTPTLYKAGNVPIALIIYKINEENILEVVTFRISAIYKLAETLTQHLVLSIIQTSVKKGCSITKISESYLSETATATLINDGFIKKESAWLKPNFSGVKTLDEALISLSECHVLRGSMFDSFLDLSEDQKISLREPKLISAFEKKLHPLKIGDSGISCFILPIQARWAAQLFDHKLAGQTLWGAKEELALRREMVYYRSARNSGKLIAPARLLWYVSEANEFSYSKSIRACSRIEEIIIGKPKELYRKYRRLGIYKFSDLQAVAKDNLDTNIMAIRFSHTEVFKDPVGYKESLEILNMKSTFQSPLKIPEDGFSKVYYKGTGNSDSSSG